MAMQLKPRLTPEEYLSIERRAEFKSEFFDGEMFAMSGASESHNSDHGQHDFGNPPAPQKTPLTGTGTGTGTGSGNSSITAHWNPWSSMC